MGVHTAGYSVITARKRSLGQGNILALVCHSVYRGGRPRQVPPGQVHPPAGTPPGRYTPWAGTLPGRYTPRQVHPLGRYTPWEGIPWQVHPRAGNTPGQVQPLGRYTPQAGTPLGRYTPQQCMLGYQSTSGRYASYSNAFLFIHTVGNDVGKLTPANTFVVVSIVQERIVYDN